MNDQLPPVTHTSCSEYRGKPVRFKCFGNGHHRPHTGYLAIRSEGANEGWVLSSNSIRQKELTTLNGEGYHKGGTTFLEELHHFVAYWAVAQADAIEKHRIWSAAKLPTQMLARPGFRAMPASKHWAGYVRDTSNEISLIKRDVEEAYRLLYVNGWTPGPDLTPFPVFMFGDPWNADPKT